MKPSTSMYECVVSAPKEQNDAFLSNRKTWKLKWYGELGNSSFCGQYVCPEVAGQFDSGVWGLILSHFLTADLPLEFVYIDCI